MNIISRLPHARTWLRLGALLLLVPFDLLVAAALWMSELVCWPFVHFSKASSAPPKPDTRRASLIVLNWDGKHLLEEYLPSVLEAVHHDGGGHEVIVVDNGSQDGSVDLLRAHFPEVKIIELPRNMRFTGGNNAGVQAAKNDIVVFLNNDMQVDPDFLRPLLDGFQGENVFAVSCQVFFQDKSRRREETGKTRMRWKRGFLEASHDSITSADARAKYVPIFWGGGGSCAFDRNKFLALDGLDTLYDPFYLEDTDLSYQAWKRGWKSLLAVESIVVHKHRGTNKLKFGDNYVDNTIRKNQYLFIWKNITDLKWIVSHPLLLPVTQARLLVQTNVKFEVRAFFRALRQFPEALRKRYRSRRSYAMTDAQIFESSSRISLQEGQNYIDFREGDFEEQLGEGWHELEKGGGESFRWMGRRGVAYLFAHGAERFLEVKGSIPKFRKFRRPYLKVEILQNDRLIFRKRLIRAEEVNWKVPVAVAPGRFHRIDLRLSASFCPARLGLGGDTRELGMIVSEIRLSNS